MPLILVVPLTVASMIALGIRTRRPAANLALAAPVLALVACLLAFWARFNKTDPYDAGYEWINVSTAFAGPSQFQSFVLSIGIRASHFTLTLSLAAIAVSAAILIWSRSRAGRLPSPARYFALQVLLLAGALGVVVATDLIELFAFWALAGASSYLLLAHAWGDEGSTAGVRLALVLPALTDICLLSGIAILYSRYGQLNLDQLIPTLTHTAGAGPRALATASILIFAGAAGRLGLLPFQAWLSASRGAPAGSFAAVQGLWPIMVAGLLVKVMPVLISAPALVFQVIAITAAASAIGLPLLGLVTGDARRLITLAGIGLSALGVLAFVRPSAPGPAALLLVATGVGRAAAILAVATMTIGVRSAELAHLGEGFRRMRLAALALAIAGAALVVGTGEVAGENLRPLWIAVYALSLLLGMLAVYRLYFIAAHGPLARRRGFDPERVRRPAASLTYPPLILAALGVIVAIAMYATGWLRFVDHRQHGARSVVAMLAWLAVSGLGAALAWFLFATQRNLGQHLTARARQNLERAGEVAGRAAIRWLSEPALRLGALAEDRLVAGGERGLAGVLASSSGLVRYRPRPAVALATALLALILLIGGAALLSVGGAR